MGFIIRTLSEWSNHLPYGLIMAIVILTYLLSCFIARWAKISLVEKIPGPKAWPIIGNTPDFIVDPREFFQRCMGLVHIWSLHTPLIRMWGGSTPVVELYVPETVEVILKSSKHIDKSTDYNFLHPWLGTGLLTSTGKKWFTRRKMLTPAFHFTILEDFITVFNSQSETMVLKLREKTNGQPFDIFPYVALCTLDIIFETALGCSINAQEDAESDYVKAVNRLASLVQRRQARPWLQPNLLYRVIGDAKEHDHCIKILHGLAYKAIRDRREKFFKKKNGFVTSGQIHDDGVVGKKKRVAFLDLLLEQAGNGDILTDEDIREEVDTFMFEGHDTTAAAINWTLYLLGCNPKIQERLYGELVEVFGQTNRAVTMADLPHLKYTENCIKEALRLFPSVPMLARELNEEVVIGNYRVPSGTSAVIFPYLVHRDPRHYPNPEVYDPDRFLPNNTKNRHPYAYIPFSAGPRNCIGQKFAMMEEKIVLTNVLRNFKVESTIRREDLRIIGELILKPEDGNILKLFPRT